MGNGEVEVLDETTFHWKFFDNRSCAVSEACVMGIGNRYIVRFPTSVHNIGNGNFVSSNPYERPDLHTYAECHQHYHFEGFASYYFLDPETMTPVAGAGKKSYCVAGTGAYQSGPKVACSTETSCENQGLEPGWSDLYAADLDCQWIDATALYETGNVNKWWMYEIGVNRQRTQPDYSYVNDVISFPVFVPCPPALVDTVVYNDFIQANPSVCCFRPDGAGGMGPDPVTCPGPVGGCNNVTMPTFDECPVVAGL
eukprot:Amastigsp_a3015_9.p2 type:complete len:254 gc:universal Amastigsp_a3015_9:784-23(-)